MPWLTAVTVLLCLATHGTAPALSAQARPATDDRAAAPRQDLGRTEEAPVAGRRRIPRRVTMPLVMGAAAAAAASAYFISEADDPVGSCTGPRCVLPMSVGVGFFVGYLMGREMDQSHALRYSRGAPVNAGGQSLTLPGEMQFLAIGPQRGAAGGTTGAAGIQLFTVDGAPRALARRAAGIRGLRALDVQGEQLTLASSTGLYEFALDSSVGARVRDGDITALARLRGRRVVAIGSRLELEPVSGAWRARDTGLSVRAMTADPQGDVLWVATDSALTAYVLSGDSLAPRTSTRLRGGARTLRSDGTRVVVAAGERGVWLYDIDGSSAPRERFLWAGARFAYDALLTHERLYVAGGGEGLYVLDARAPRGTVLGLARHVGFAIALGERGEYTYVLDRAAPAVHRIRSDFPLR
ncbi:MAG: hypothetical protein P3B98_05960 [Gemmatimonadota bacterium]|nr:hypothetical protein [Gemmatimonadota bacterium]